MLNAQKKTIRAILAELGLEDRCAVDHPCALDRIPRAWDWCLARGEHAGETFVSYAGSALVSFHGFERGDDAGGRSPVYLSLVSASDSPTGRESLRLVQSA